MVWLVCLDFRSCCFCLEFGVLIDKTFYDINLFIANMFNLLMISIASLGNRLREECAAVKGELLEIIRGYSETRIISERIRVGESASVCLLVLGLERSESRPYRAGSELYL